jgi:hypothetical protein
MSESVRRSLLGCLTRLLDRKGQGKVDRKGLAAELGVHYRSLSYWLSADRSLPAEYLPGICNATADYTLLDVLEREVGRVSFKLPTVADKGSGETLVQVQQLIKSVGRALESVAETLQDGVVEDRELEVTLPKLDEVIRQCILLRHLLESHCVSRKRRAVGRGRNL